MWSSETSRPPGLQLHPLILDLGTEGRHQLRENLGLPCLGIAYALPLRRRRLCLGDLWFENNPIKINWLGRNAYVSALRARGVDVSL